MASLQLTRAEVFSNLSTLLGVNRTYGSLDSQTQSDFQRVWRSGFRKFLAAHEWRHLEERHTFVIPAAQESSTITVVDGVVTLASGTWPSWAANGVLITSEGVFEVNTRDGDTQLTLYDTSYDDAALTTYVLRPVKFDLPSNFARFIEPLTLENQQSHELDELPMLPEWTLRAVGGNVTPILDKPEAFTLFQSVDETTNAFTPFLKVYPIPDAQYTVTGVIGVTLDDTLSSADSVAICNPLFAELLQEAILSSGEIMFRGGPGKHTKNFADWLPSFIQKDNVYRGVRTLRPRNYGKRGTWNRRYIDPQGWTGASQFPFQ